MTHVRDARPADAARLAEIHAASWQAAYRGLISDAYLDELTPTARLAWWDSRLSRVPSRWAVLVTEDRTGVTGFVTIGHCYDDDRPDKGELYAMYVDPRSWGVGWGRKLLLGAEDRFRTYAYPDASLWVLRSNHRARRFYEVGEWSADGAEKQMTIGPDIVTAVRYLRKL